MNYNFPTSAPLLATASVFIDMTSVISTDFNSFPDNHDHDYPQNYLNYLSSPSSKGVSQNQPLSFLGTSIVSLLRNLEK